jgi:hypothetical protein
MAAPLLDHSNKVSLPMPDMSMTTLEEEYGPTKSKLEKACQEGCGFNAELRFIQKEGELLHKSPEEFLRTDLKFAPLYDLNLQKKLSQ